MLPLSRIATFCTIQNILRAQTILTMRTFTPTTNALVRLPGATSVNASGSVSVEMLRAMQRQPWTVSLSQG